MMLLRKKRQSAATNNPSGAGSTSAGSLGLRHSLSLPDLTTPLLDPASWEEIPAFQHYPSLSNRPPSLLARNRSPSLVSGPPGSPVAFHRPFRGVTMQVPAPALAPATPPVPPSAFHAYAGDFRKSTLSAHGGHGHGHGLGYGLGLGTPPPPSPRKRRAMAKAKAYNVVVVGGQGSGKTRALSDLIKTSSFTRSSLTLPVSPSHPAHARGVSPAQAQGRERELDGSTPCSPTSPGAPVPLTLGAKPGPALPAAPAPTRRMGSTVLDGLRLIDTPGLDLRSGPLHAIARERGVAALLALAEGRFDEVLREERKVVRRGVEVDGLVHLCVYVVDARTLLPRSGVEPEWSLEGAFESMDVEMRAVHTKVPEEDLTTIRALSKRLNVLPVLTHADALSMDELEAVRQALAGALANDELFGATADDINSLSQGQGNTPSPPTPALTDRSGRSTPSPSPSQSPSPSSPSQPRSQLQLPYAVFTAPRTFAWGTAVPRAHSDVVALKDLILDSAHRARSSTREVLYETYRTERLLAHRARKGISEESDM